MHEERAASKQLSASGHHICVAASAERALQHLLRIACAQEGAYLQPLEACVLTRDYSQRPSRNANEEEFANA